VRRPILAAATVGSLLLAAGCPSRKAEPPASGATVASSGSARPSAPTGVSASASASTSSGPAGSASVRALASVPVPTLVSAEAWDEALLSIAALPASEASSLATRLSRARALVGRCEPRDATPALDEIAALRAAKEGASIAPVLDSLEVDAWVCGGQWKEALAAPAPQGLAARPGATAQRTLARALEAVEDYKGARAAIDRALTGATAAGLSSGALRVTRARLDAKLADTGALAADFRLLFVAHPRDYDAALAAGQTAPSLTLSAADWLQRADALASLGREADATAALDEAQKLGADARKLARARGWVAYRAKAYAKAIPALLAAAKLATDADALSDAFHAARAKSRAGDDDAAIADYEALAKAHPTSHWGCEAQHLAAQLRWLHGKWGDAIDAYDRYLKGACPKGAGQEQNVREARRARAFALLEAGKHDAARKALQALATSAYDKDSLAQGRISLLAAIAAQRAGDTKSATSELERLATVHPWGYLELASRGRLVKLGSARTPWPTGPIAPFTPVTLPAPASLLHLAGLDGEARGRLPAAFARDDVGRCALASTLESAEDAWALGNRLDLSVPPDATRAWAWRCAFPTPWAPLVDALEAREGLPPGLLDAIVRQESAFKIGAVSPVGALGIAQLMPATAASTAKDAGLALDPDDVAKIQSPWIQLDLGARHLAALYRELAPAGTKAARDDATPLVVAAYNAGSPAVKRWLGEAGGLDADVFLERIPFLETRGYVARVLGNLVRYSILRGAPPPTLPATFASAASKP
jgi:soluble lytic murein transglycosylase